MSKINGGPAFPSHTAVWGHDGQFNIDTTPGMDLCDWFAGQALKGWLSDPNMNIGHIEDPESAARIAAGMYSMAEAMVYEKRRRSSEHYAHLASPVDSQDCPCLTTTLRSECAELGCKSCSTIKPTIK